MSQDILPYIFSGNRNGTLFITLVWKMRYINCLIIMIGNIALNKDKNREYKMDYLCIL